MYDGIPVPEVSGGLEKGGALVVVPAGGGIEVEDMVGADDPSGGGAKFPVLPMLSKYEGNPEPPDGCLKDFGMYEPFSALSAVPPDRLSANDAMPAVFIDGVVGDTGMLGGVLSVENDEEDEGGVVKVAPRGLATLST